MTEPRAAGELVSGIKIGACEAGHVHVTFMRADGSDIATAIFEIDEAVTHAASVSVWAEIARVSLASVPGIVGGDVSKH